MLTQQWEGTSLTLGSFCLSGPVTDCVPPLLFVYLLAWESWSHSLGYLQASLWSLQYGLEVLILLLPSRECGLQLFLLCSAVQCSEELRVENYVGPCTMRGVLTCSSWLTLRFLLHFSFLLL